MSHRILSPFERAKIGTVGKAIMVSEFLGLFIALASLIALFTVQTEEDLLLFGVIILIPGVFFVCVICWVLSAFNQMKNSTTQPNLKKAASLYLGVFVFSFISSFFSGFIELAIEVGIFILYPVDIVINAITCVIYYLVWKEFFTFFSEYKQNNTPADMANFDSIISLSKWLQIFVLIDIIPIVNIFSSIITSILTITWGLKVQREFPPSAFGYMGPQEIGRAHV